MKKTFVVALVIAVSLLAGGQAVQAGLNANVSTDAQCAPGDLGWKELSVDAGLIQKDVPSVGPYVSIVNFSLEQHFPTTNKWAPVPGSAAQQDVYTSFTLLQPGERYYVATQIYPNICNNPVSKDANAVRAVVDITVTNGKNKQVYTGRCISIPNPCK